MTSRKRKEKLWNSLEVSKLIVSAFLPLTILILGLMINQSLQKDERVFNNRIKIYSQVGDTLNDVNAYFTYVGDWKKYSPIDVLNMKRKLDKTIRVYRPFFTARFFTQYKNFINLVFEKRNIDLYSETRLRTSYQIRKEKYIQSGKHWKLSWDKLFTNEGLGHQKISSAYNTLVRDLAKELDVK